MKRAQPRSGVSSRRMIRTGMRRYYDNFLYAFAFLALAGEYRVW